MICRKHCSENLKGRDNKEDLGIEGRITLEWILGKRGEVRTGYIWFRIGTRSSLL
jgi:hypothetical protein